MKYSFKEAPELVWFVGVAIGTQLLQVLMTFEPDKILDWQSWAVSLLAAAIRTGAGAALDWIGSHSSPKT